METIFAAKFRKKPHLLYDREILHMPDGGCVCLDTEDLPPHKVPRMLCDFAGPVFPTQALSGFAPQLLGSPVILRTLSLPSC